MSELHIEAKGFEGDDAEGAYKEVNEALQKLFVDSTDNGDRLNIRFQFEPNRDIEQNLFFHIEHIDKKYKKHDLLFLFIEKRSEIQALRDYLNTALEYIEKD